jgi:hypothetical protein
VTTYLLDVNLLLALSDPMHVHHEVAHRWFADAGGRSCAEGVSIAVSSQMKILPNGVVRSKDNLTGQSASFQG